MPGQGWHLTMFLYELAVICCDVSNINTTFIIWDCFNEYLTYERNFAYKSRTFKMRCKCETITSRTLGVIIFIQYSYKHSVNFKCSAISSLNSHIELPLCKLTQTQVVACSAFNVPTRFNPSSNVQYLQRSGLKWQGHQTTETCFYRVTEQPGRSG